MKKIITIVVAICLVFFLTSCDVSNNDTQINIQELTTENASLKEKNQELTNEIKKLKEAEESKKESTIVQDEDITVTLIDKTTQENDYGQQFINCVFTVTNNTDKDIKGIQGTANFNDLFGVRILQLNCDFVGSIIEQGSSITVSNLSLKCNRFMDGDMKLYNTTLDNIKFEYQATSIVFTDGTTKSVTTN